MRPIFQLPFAFDDDVFQQLPVKFMSPPPAFNRLVGLYRPVPVLGFASIPTFLG